jgi:hypothetical protein
MMALVSIGYSLYLSAYILIIHKINHHGTPAEQPNRTTATTGTQIVTPQKQPLLHLPGTTTITSLLLIFTLSQLQPFPRQPQSQQFPEVGGTEAQPPALACLGQKVTEEVEGVEG